jgi:oligopeptide transport system permease protein
MSAQTEVQGRSLWVDAWRRLVRNRAAVAAGIILGVMVLLVVFAPWFSTYAYDQTHWDKVSIAPNLAEGHIFGTDALGRDLFVRTLHGGRISLLVGLAATLVSLVIGVAWGATAGYVGSRAGPPRRVPR